MDEEHVGVTGVPLLVAAETDLRAVSIRDGRVIPRAPREADDDAVHGSRDRSRTADRSELSGFIQNLNVDEQIDLVALMWLGRGDGELDNWNDLRAEASRAHNNRTASYLIETPMLADYLEEALSQFGMSPEDFEEPL